MMNTDTEYSESQATLMVPDLDEAVIFYTATLGLRLKARYGKEFAVVEAPGLTIGLHPQAKEHIRRSVSLTSRGLAEFRSIYANRASGASTKGVRS
jgi:catechol-2,3-dioxygenase